MSRTVEMDADIAWLFDFVQKDLYREDWQVAPRELVQNAHDAIRRRRTLEPDCPGEITVTVGPAPNGASQLLTVTDTGIGMTEDELLAYVNRIGASGTRVARAEAVARGGRDADFKGMFGVGLLSTLPLSRSVEIATRKVGSMQAARWVNQGTIRSEIGPAERATVGTTVTMTLKDEFSFLDEERLYDCLRRYCSLLEEPVRLNGRPVNQSVPWRTSRVGQPNEREYRRFFDHNFSRDVPLDIIPVELMHGDIEAYGLLYIPSEGLPGRARAGVDLYVSDLYLRSQADILPSWAKEWVSGLITTPSLRPNAGRDDAQKGPALERLRAELGRLILDRLSHLAAHDRRTFEAVFRTQHYHIKSAAEEDTAFFEVIADLLTFPTNRGWRTLDECVSDSDRGGAGEVFYIADAAARDQFFRLADGAGLTLVDANNLFDESLLRRCAYRRGVTLSRIQTADDARLFRAPDDPDRYARLCAAMTDTLRGSGLPDSTVSARVFHPADLPVVALLSAETASALALREEVAAPSAYAMAGLDALFSEAADRYQGAAITLQINAANPLIRALARRPGTEPGLRRLYGVLALWAISRVENLSDLYAPRLERELFLLLQEVAEGSWEGH